MPLLTCPDCQGKVSDQAAACPHCGRPVEAPIPPYVPLNQRTAKSGDDGARGGCIAVFLGVAGLMILFAVFGSSHNTSEPASGSGSEPSSLGSSSVPTGNPTPTTSDSSSSAPSEPPASDPAPPAPSYDLKRLSMAGAEDYGYITVSGEVKNLTDHAIKDVEAVTTFYDGNGNAIDTTEALIEYNPIMPGQVSPYKTMHTANPAIKRFGTAFKVMFGEEIRTDYSASAPHSSSRKKKRHHG